MARNMDVRELPVDAGAPPPPGPPAPAGWRPGGDDGASGWEQERAAARADQKRVLRLVVDLLVVGACVAFVLWHR
jgi:hypothetical protein